jgi:hypothetical protein
VTPLAEGVDVYTRHHEDRDRAQAGGAVCTADLTEVAVATGFIERANNHLPAE